MTTTELSSKYSKEEYVRPPEGGLASCAGCGGTIAIKQLVKATGGDISIVTTMGCPTKPPMNFRGKPIKDLTSQLGVVANIASGFKSALEARGEKDTVIAWAGDGATFDIGFQAISACADRNEDIIFVCYDNESYANTGGQRSSATPFGARTSTNPLPKPKKEQKKDIMLALAAHDIPYAATATVAFPEDLTRKAKKAKETKGFRFLHILTPCPTEWRYPTELTIQMSRMAVESNVFPLFEIEDGIKLTINYYPEKVLPLEEYLKPQGRFKALTAEQTAQIQAHVDRRWDRLQYLAKYRPK